MTDNPLAKLGDLTKPATVLIEKISDAVGGIFKPYQVVRLAKGRPRQIVFKTITVSYYGRQTALTFPADTGNVLKLGKVLLTRAGQQLAPVCGSTPIDEFFDFIYDRWAEHSLVPKRETEQLA